MELASTCLELCEWLDGRDGGRLTIAEGLSHHWTVNSSMDRGVDNSVDRSVDRSMDRRVDRRVDGLD